MRFLGYPPTDGALRQYIAWPAELLVAAGEQTSFDQLAMAEPLAVALYALQCGGPGGARSAAVIGCGAIGLLLVQLLSRGGTSPLLAADQFDHKLALARDFGATDVVDTSKQDIVSSAQRTTPRGFDLVFEMAGDVDAPGWAVELAAPAGRVVLGGINPHETIRYKASTARRRGLVIANLRRSKDTTRQAVEMIERGHIEVDRLVTHRFGLAQVNDAFDLFMAYRDNVVKICIDPASE
jgi:L-iditol 2-dehydrogenase